MGQFSVYKNPNPVTQDRYPYLLDIQSDLLAELKTTVVIPLSPAKIFASISLSRLNPTLVLEGEGFIAMTQDIAGVDRSELGAQVRDLSEHRSDIISAVDFLISGI